MSGDFVLPRDPATPVLLVAAGIGITPYVAQLAGASAGNPAGDRDVVLLYLAKSAAELGYAEELHARGRASCPGWPTVRRRRPTWRTQAPKD